LGAAVLIAPLLGVVSSAADGQVRARTRRRAPPVVKSARPRIRDWPPAYYAYPRPKPDRAYTRAAIAEREKPAERIAYEREKWGLIGTYRRVILDLRASSDRLPRERRRAITRVLRLASGNRAAAEAKLAAAARVPNDEWSRTVPAIDSAFADLQAAVARAKSLAAGADIRITSSH
jgi:hypothetical protein